MRGSGLDIMQGIDSWITPMWGALYGNQGPDLHLMRVGQVAIREKLAEEGGSVASEPVDKWTMEETITGA